MFEAVYEYTCKLGETGLFLLADFAIEFYLARDRARADTIKQSTLGHQFIVKAALAKC